MRNPFLESAPVTMIHDERLAAAAPCAGADRPVPEVRESRTRQRASWSRGGARGAGSGPRPDFVSKLVGVTRAFGGHFA
jgi:hypothetical protein